MDEKAHNSNHSNFFSDLTSVSRQSKLTAPIGAPEPSTAAGGLDEGAEEIGTHPDVALKEVVERTRRRMGTKLRKREGKRLGEEVG